MNNQLTISRVTNDTNISFPDLNTLFDTGTVWDSEQGKKFLDNPDNVFFLATWDGVVAGFVSGHRLQRFDNRKAEVLLYEIGVAENFRQKGIGTALVEKLKDWGREVGADEVWVLTEKSNLAATALYHSAGGVVEHPDDVLYVFKL